MRIARINEILFQGLIAIILVLYFSCFGQTPTFLGALREMFSLVSDTLRGQNLLANYMGVTWSQVWDTLRLVFMSVLFAFLLGITLVALRIVWMKLPFAWLFEFISAVLEAIPEPMYVVAMVVWVLFLINHWQIYFFPVFRSGQPGILDTIVPAVTLALPGGFYLERILYMSILDEIDKPYVQTAVSKGLSHRSALFKHVLPNGLEATLRQMPVVSSIIISSALFTEFFMNYEGALYQFTFAVGWNMMTGYFQEFAKPFHLPLYQPGLVFLLAGLLVLLWVFFRITFEWIYTVRYGMAS